MDPASTFAPRNTPVTAPDENSKRTRVDPVFTWLRERGGKHWPARFIELADGIADRPDVGKLIRLDFETERKVAPSPQRLAWMIENVERLAPRDGRQWREYQTRVTHNPARDAVLAKLKQGQKSGIDARLKLEGSTSADCLIECEHAFIWIEGKRNDWLDYSTTWDVTRDQLARNAEAAWLLAKEHGKQAALVVCHEHGLKHHEQALLNGYRGGTWSAGWPHLDAADRQNLGSALGTLTWESIVAEWPQIGPFLDSASGGQNVGPPG